VDGACLPTDDVGERGGGVQKVVCNEKYPLGSIKHLGKEGGDWDENHYRDSLIYRLNFKAEFVSRTLCIYCLQIGSIWFVLGLHILFTYKAWAPARFLKRLGKKGVSAVAPIYFLL